MMGWRHKGSIRGQLVAALILVVIVATGVLVVGMMVMLRAEHDFRALAEERIPAVALAGELAEATGELAALTMQVVAAPETHDESMKRSINNASAAVEAVLESPIWLAAPGRYAARTSIETAEGNLRRALAEFGRLSAELERLRQVETRTDADLRWAHADVQGQVQGILSDLSFNMDTQLATLVDNGGLMAREGARQALSQDWLLRDRIQQIGSEAATLTALLLQARASDRLEAIEQTATLGRDTLDLLELAQLNLPQRIDVTLLLQALKRLKGLALEPGSIFAQVRQRLALHQAVVNELHSAQAALADMQARLTDLGRAERIDAQRRADAAATGIMQGSLWLGMVTLLGAVVTAIILAIFVHKRILLRIERLSNDLTFIAQGDSALHHKVSNVVRGDEIANMARAVKVFRASVYERQQAIERLELTQRELVQAGKMAALGQMSAAISHEINQPLAAIGHRLHNLGAAHPETRLAIARIEALLERITRTIGHLRRIARRSAHRNIRIILAEPVQAALELLDHRLRSEGVHVECDDLAGVDVSGDDILLEQVLLNILGNALDAIESRENVAEPGLIRIELTKHDPILLVIRDNGVGLGGQSGLALTDPFVTTKEPGKGLGLGLSIAFNVMQDMGGHLEIEQHPQGGAEVRLRLGRWQDEEKEVMQCPK